LITLGVHDGRTSAEEMSTAGDMDVRLAKLRRSEGTAATVIFDGGSVLPENHVRA
jgi:hypothetical protein